MPWRWSSAVKDAHDDVLADGDYVMLTKDWTLKGLEQVLKSGKKSKPTRLGEGDHEICCGLDGIPIGLKACLMKKA